MPKYIVEVWASKPVVATVEVDASDKQDAIEAAYDAVYDVSNYEWRETKPGVDFDSIDIMSVSTT